MRIPGIFWGENENYSDGEDEHEIQMIEVVAQDTVNTVNFTDNITRYLVKVMIFVSEGAKLFLCLVGTFTLARWHFCDRRRVATRSVATQSQCTYTFVRDVQTPRFQVLSEDQQSVEIHR